MELELLKMLARRFGRRPLLMGVWIALCALPWALAAIGPFGPAARSALSSRMIYEVAFMWGLVGCSLGLAALGDISPALDPLSRGRRLRAQTAVLGLCTFLPAIPLLALSLPALTPEEAPFRPSAVLLMGLHLIAIGLVTVQLGPGPVRSIVFLSLAWLIPALVSPPIRAMVVQVLDATRHLETTSGSSAWPAAFAPILALVLIAIGVDGVRRPAT